MSSLFGRETLRNALVHTYRHMHELDVISFRQRNTERPSVPEVGRERGGGDAVFEQACRPLIFQIPCNEERSLGRITGGYVCQLSGTGWKQLITQRRKAGVSGNTKERRSCPLGTDGLPSSRRVRWQALSRGFYCRLGKRHVWCREQKGRFVASCWIAQMYQDFAQPKAISLEEWEKLPDWQRETAAALCKAVEQPVMAEVIAA